MNVSIKIGRFGRTDWELLGVAVKLLGEEMPVDAADSAKVWIEADRLRVHVTVGPAVAADLFTRLPESYGAEVMGRTTG